MSKRVMILGAGREQVPIIKTCRNAGAEIIVISPPGSYPGFRYADRYYHYDVKDYTSVLKIAQRENIDAVLSDQLDAAVRTTAYVAEQLNLPGMGYEVALKFTNKLIMRREAQLLGIKVPRYYGVTSIDKAYNAAAAIGYPVIIKPADSAASRGVFRIDDENQLREHFTESLRFSTNKQVIIEQLLAGKEYVVQSFSQNHETSNLIIGHRDFFDLSNLFIPRAAVYIDVGSVQSEIEKDILNAHNKLVQGFGLNFGISYGEYLHNYDDGEVYLVEIAARGAATFTSSDLIPLASGVNANQMLVDLALGIKSTCQAIQPRSGAAAYFCFILPTGRIVKIENSEPVESIQGVHQAWFDTIAIGQSTPDVRDKGARKGPILVHGRNKQDCYDAIERVKRVLKIEVQTDKGLEGIQW